MPCNLIIFLLKSFRRPIGYSDAMDKTLFVILVTACICASYKNERNLPPPFQGNLASPVDISRYPKSSKLPYYTRTYGDISAGIMFE